MNKNQFNNNASTLLAHCLFIICTLVFCWCEILAHNTFMACNLAFSLACMFLQVVKCRYQKFFLHLISLHTLLWTIINFPSHFTIYCNPWQFHDPHFLETWFNTHSLFLCFFSRFFGSSFRDSILRAREDLIGSRDDNGDKGSKMGKLWHNKIMSIRFGL